MTETQQPPDVPVLALPVDRAAAAVGLAEHTFRRLVLAAPTLGSSRSSEALRRSVSLSWLDMNGRFSDEDE